MQSIPSGSLIQLPDHAAELHLSLKGDMRYGDRGKDQIRIDWEEEDPRDRMLRERYRAEQEEMRVG